MIETVEVITMRGEKRRFGSVLEPVRYNFKEDGSLTIRVTIIGQREETIVFAKGAWESVGIRERNEITIPPLVSPSFDRAMQNVRDLIDSLGVKNTDGSTSWPFEDPDKMNKEK